jgi:hypothetical protein
VVEEAARREDLIAYSDLVRGITFNLSNVRESPLELGVPQWTDLHRAILGGFLGRISCDSYEQAGFLARAVAVSGTDSQPSERFKALVKELDVVSTQGDAYLAFWIDQVHRHRSGTKQTEAREISQSHRSSGRNPQLRGSRALTSAALAAR